MENAPAYHLGVFRRSQTPRGRTFMGCAPIATLREVPAVRAPPLLRRPPRSEVPEHLVLGHHPVHDPRVRWVLAHEARPELGRRRGDAVPAPEGRGVARSSA